MQLPCWLLGYKNACEVSSKCPDTQVIMVGDRESDIYDIYDYAEKLSGTKADWLVRAKINYRALIDENGNRLPVLLNEKFKSMKTNKLISFQLPKRNGESGKTIKQKVKYSEVILHPPTGRRGERKCSPVKVTVIHAKEVGKSNNPVEWWLISNIPISELDCPTELIKFYLLRWQIEVFFRVLKSGCKVEELQLVNNKRLRPCLMLYMIVAWRIMLATSTAKVCPDISCELLFTKEEWHFAWAMNNKSKPPNMPPSIGTIVKLIAKLGGYLCRSSDSPPGPKAMWLGLNKLYENIRGFKQMESLNTYG